MPLGSSALSGPGGVSVRPWLTPEVIAEVEKQLAQAIGPMARLLLKNEGRKAKDLASLCEALSLHVDNPEQRARFLKAVASLGSH